MSERGLLQLVSVSFQPIEQTLALDTLDCSSQMNELPCEILVLMPHISLLRHRGVQISLTSLQLSEHDHEPSGSSGGTHPVSVASGNRDCCFPPPPPHSPGWGDTGPWQVPPTCTVQHLPLVFLGRKRHRNIKVSCPRILYNYVIGPATRTFPSPASLLGLCSVYSYRSCNSSKELLLSETICALPLQKLFGRTSEMHS